MAYEKSKKKSTVKIVGAINTVHSPEYCYSLCGNNIIAHFRKKFNRNREKIGFVAKFFAFNFDVAPETVYSES